MRSFRGCTSLHDLHHAVTPLPKHAHLNAPPDWAGRFYEHSPPGSVSGGFDPIADKYPKHLWKLLSQPRLRVHSANLLFEWFSTVERRPRRGWALQHYTYKKVRFYMNTVTKCLFGGALLGAGVSSSALAGNFIWTGGFAYASATLGSTDFAPIMPDGFAANSVSLFGSASVHGGASGLSMLTYSSYSPYGSAPEGGPSGGPGSLAQLNGQFFVTETMTVTIEWDFSGEVSPYGGYPPMASSLFIGGFGASGLSGSTEIVMFAGHLQFIDALIVSSSPLFGTLNGNLSSISIYETPAIVPLPPAAFAGLGMLAGLGAYKRLRRAK